MLFDIHLQMKIMKSNAVKLIFESSLNYCSQIEIKNYEYGPRRLDYNGHGT